MVVVLCEGKTEAAIRNGLREVVQRHCVGDQQSSIKTIALGGTLFCEKTRRYVGQYAKQPDVKGIVALTDVYPEFSNADDARRALTEHVGDKAGRVKFRAHAAKFEIEAWLLPFWDEIATSIGSALKGPKAPPENVNELKPPSVWLHELFRKTPKRKGRFEKAAHGPKWLTADRLEKAATFCPELKAFLNSLIELAGGEVIA